MELLLADLQGHPVAWAFLQPVNADEVPDYHDVIKEPMGAHIIYFLRIRLQPHRLQHNGEKIGLG